MRPIAALVSTVTVDRSWVRASAAGSYPSMRPSAKRRAARGAHERDATRAAAYVVGCSSSIVTIPIGSTGRSRPSVCVVPILSTTS
jgi:hypothetical protein